MPSIVLACAMALAVGSPHASWQRTDELAAMVRADSNEAQGHYLLGLLFIRREKYDRAEASLRTAIALDSRQAEAHLALAQLPYLQRPQLGSEEARGRVPDAWEARLDEARKFYRRAFVIDPLVSLRSMSMLFPQGRWRGRDYTSDESKSYELFFEGFDDLASGRYRDALQRLDQLAKQVFHGERDLDRIPEFVLWARGMAAARVRADSIAIRDFQALVARGEKRERDARVVPVQLRTNEYRYILGVFHQRAADTTRAIELLRGAAEADLGLDMAHVRLAEIHRARRDIAAEMQERQRAVQSNPEDATLLLELAMLRYEVGELEEAEDELQRATALNPRDPRAFYLLGVILQGQRRMAEARTMFERAAAVAPKSKAYIADDARARIAKLP
jgi:tetratricopeptide (TPR) repeat protein